MNFPSTVVDMATAVSGRGASNGGGASGQEREGLPSSAYEKGDCLSWPSRELELEASSSAAEGERARRLS